MVLDVKTKKGFCLWGQFSSKDMKILNKMKNRAVLELKTVDFHVHITLLKYLEKTGPEITQIISNKCSVLEPISICGIKYEITSSFFKSLYIKIDVSKELLQLRRSFAELNESEIDDKFFPHISLAYGCNIKNKKIALIRNFNILPTNFILDKVCLVSFDTTRLIWKIEKQFLL